MLSRRFLVILGVCFSFANCSHSSPSCRAQEIQVVVDYVAPGQATKDYRFPTVPAISTSDAGNLVTARLIEGQADFNGAPPGVLFDGQAARNQDDPQNNYFLAGNESGRLLIDLGKSIELLQFNTYSWHPFLRGPQVYTLYGFSQPSNFNDLDQEPQFSTDLSTSGWTKVANVDSRVQHGLAGGQYGVSVRRDNGQAIGKFRYLLMAISPTDVNRRDSQTFFSEIDIVDGQTYPERKESELVDTLDIDGKYQITFDTSEVPELRSWVDKVLKPVCRQWYPKIVELFPSENYDPPKSFTIYFHRDMSGVANASGTRINCAGRWFLSQLNGEATGAVVHEMVHIVQQYPGRRGRNANPGWLVEGVADYVRWFLFEPEENRPKPDPRRANYTDSYRTTAAFINYVTDKYDKTIVTKLNAAMRQGKYSEALWMESTGKSPQELWNEYVETELK